MKLVMFQYKILFTVVASVGFILLTPIALSVGTTITYNGVSETFVIAGTQDSSVGTSLDSNDNNFWNISSSSQSSTVTIFSDNFEGGLGNWVANSPWISGTGCTGNGATAKNTGGVVKYLTRAQSTSGYTNIQAIYTIKQAQHDAGQDFIGSEWFDGTTWNNIQEIQGPTACTQYTFNLPAGAENNANFQFRFKCKNNANNEICTADEFTLQGNQNQFNASANFTSKQITQSVDLITRLDASLTFTFNTTSGNWWYELFNFAIDSWESGTSGTFSTTETTQTITKTTGITDYINSSGFVKVRLITGSTSAAYKLMNEYHNLTITAKDLETTREAPKTVGISKNFGMRFVVRNIAGVDLTNVQLNDTIPSGWTYVACSPSAICSFDSPNSRVTWNIGSLAANNIYTLANYTVASASSGSGTFNSLATCTSCQDTTESFAVDTDSASVAHYAIDLDPDVRDNFISTSKTFSFRVTNIGNVNIGASDNANVNIFVNKSFTSLTSSCTVSGGGTVNWNVSCPISALNTGSSTTVSFTATTPSTVGIYPVGINTTGNGSFTTQTTSNLVQNGNFTGGSSTAWTYAENDVDNVASSNFATTGGNLDPGVWYFRVFDNSATKSYTAYGNLTNDGGSWTSGTPQSAILQFAYKQTWSTNAPTTNDIAVYLIKPDNSEDLLFTRSSTANDASFTYQSISIDVNNFTQSGTYKIRLYNKVVTPSAKSTVQNYWDDIAVVLVSTPQTSYIQDNQTFFTKTKAGGGDATPPIITIQSPENITYSTSSIWANVTLNEAGSWCGRSLDGGANVTMTNSTGNWNNLMTGVTATTHNVKFYCNDTAGNMNTTNVTFTKSPTISISLTNSLISFGDLTIGQTNDTTDNSPLPFVIQNDGDVSVNVTIESTNLWGTSANPTSNYQFMCTATAEAACATGSVTTFTNIPASGNPTIVIAFLNYADSSDTNEAEINITAPADEAGGSKSSTVTFIASQA